jgi:hypothetical protein
MFVVVKTLMTAGAAPPPVAVIPQKMMFSLKVEVE